MAKVVYDGKEDVTVTGRGLIIAVAVLVALAVVIFGGWRLGWWFKAENVNRSAAIDRQSLAFQQARVDSVTRKTAERSALIATIATTQDDAQVAQLKAQSQALQIIICQDYAQLTPAYKNTLDPATIAKLDQSCL